MSIATEEQGDKVLLMSRVLDRLLSFHAKVSGYAVHESRIPDPSLVVVHEEHAMENLMQALLVIAVHCDLNSYYIGKLKRMDVSITVRSKVGDSGGRKSTEGDTLDSDAQQNSTLCDSTAAEMLSDLEVSLVAAPECSVISRQHEHSCPKLENLTKKCKILQTQILALEDEQALLQQDN